MSREFCFRYNNRGNEDYLRRSDQRMLKRLLCGPQMRLFVFAAFLIVGAFGGAFWGIRSVGTSLPSLNNQPAQTRPANKPDDQEQPTGWWDWTTHDPAGFYTFVLDILTGLVFVAGAFLSVYTYRLWSAGERTLVVSYPPHIRVKHVSLESDIWAGEEIRIRLSIVNVGKAPAHIFLNHIVTVIQRAGRDLPNYTGLPPESTSAPEPSPYLLESGITLVFENQTDGRRLTDSDNAAIRDGTSRLYVIGRIEYRDESRRVKTTAYCRVLKLPYGANAAERGRFVRHDDPDYDYED